MTPAPTTTTPATASAAPRTATSVLPPLRIGPLVIDTPVVLAPMAGVTNAAYRQLCREQGAGLYICEMITSRGVVARDSRFFQHPHGRRRIGRCTGLGG